MATTWKPPGQDCMDGAAARHAAEVRRIAESATDAVEGARQVGQLLGSGEDGFNRLWLARYRLIGMLEAKPDDVSALVGLGLATMAAALYGDDSDRPRPLDA